MEGLSPGRPLEALISLEVGWGSQLLRSWYGENWPHAGQPGTSFCREKISAVGKDHHPASISPTVRPTSPGLQEGGNRKQLSASLPVDQFQEVTGDWADL